MEGDSPPGRLGVEGTRLFFGPFELRTDSGELFRDGVRINLQPQPARLLEMLARRAGEVVSREEVRCHLWGAGTFIESEQALNFSIRRIRLVLGDSATSPRYIETVPRRGYRFLETVRTEVPADPVPAPEKPRRWSGSRFAVSLVLGLVLLAEPPDRRPQPERLSAAAFQAYTEGRFLAQRRAPGDRERAIALLENATALAPGFAPAHAASARAWLDFGRPPEDVVAPAESEARRALALSSCLNEARLVLVDIDLYFRFDWSKAKTEIDRALACDSRDLEAYRAQAAWLAMQGRFAEAIEAPGRRSSSTRNPRWRPPISPGVPSWRGALTSRSTSAGGRSTSSPRTCSPGRSGSKPLSPPASPRSRWRKQTLSSRSYEAETVTLSRPSASTACVPSGAWLCCGDQPAPPRLPSRLSIWPSRRFTWETPSGRCASSEKRAGGSSDGSSPSSPSIPASTPCERSPASIEFSARSGCLRPGVSFHKRTRSRSRSRYPHRSEEDEAHRRRYPCRPRRPGSRPPLPR